MNGNGKEGNNRGKNYRRRERDIDLRSPSQERSYPNFEKTTGGQTGKPGGRGGRRDKRIPFVERPKWTAPRLSTDPIPHPPCPYCGKPIKDMSTAIADKESGKPSHFECVAARIAEGETLESGDAVVYIGGGRFGLVHFPGMGRDSPWSRKNGDDYDAKGFQIKKIFEWESRENRAPWRKDIEDHFSVI
ncbi:MAG: hypothetical protein LBF63_03950 [Treponema sp.]|jgi:hypothetical protein|nr:hypothetical protein [Treponema sp.]